MNNAIISLADDTIANGGATYNLTTSQKVTSGIAVAIPGHERIIPNFASLSRSELVEELVEYIVGHTAFLSGVGAVELISIGTWVNEEDGALYIDLVDVVADRLRAVALGRSRGELAVFDLGTFEEIRTGVVR